MMDTTVSVTTAANVAGCGCTAEIRIRRRRRTVFCSMMMVVVVTTALFMMMTVSTSAFVVLLPQQPSMLFPSVVGTTSCSRIGGGCVLDKIRSKNRSLLHSNTNTKSDALSNEEEVSTTVVSSTTTTPKRTSLSRPERKALERKQKKNTSAATNSNSKGGNRIGRRPKSKQQQSTSQQKTEPPPLELKSMDDIMKCIKKCQNTNNFVLFQRLYRTLITDYDDTQQFAFINAYGFRGSIVARIAVAALHFVHVFEQQQDNNNNNKRTSVNVVSSKSGKKAQTMVEKALSLRRTEHVNTIQPMESAAILRGYLRANNNITMAWDIYDTELCCSNNSDNDDDTVEILQYRALALASIANRHYYNLQPHEATYAMNLLSDLGGPLSSIDDDESTVTIPWARLLRGAAACQVAIRSGEYTADDDDDDRTTSANNKRRRRTTRLPCNVVYSVLNAMVAHRAENCDETYELLANALVRRVVFCTGAVSMDGCPAPDRGEVCFLGRSNVGKSSLINMICNRKSIAFVSKRPGKTQQFNYFGVNDAPDKAKFIRYGDEMQTSPDDDTFYMVDLPGFGYAKVPESVKAEWKSFMSEYIANRGPTLRVIFHLIDSRHGPTSDDTEFMKTIAGTTKSTVKYVVVLTKADKKKQKRMDDTVRATMVTNGVGSAPIVLSSAVTKLGRDAIWNYLRLANSS